MESAVYAIFGVVYLGMILGGLPGLALDRTGVALLGALALVAFGVLTPEDAWAAIDSLRSMLAWGLPTAPNRGSFHLVPGPPWVAVLPALDPTAMGWKQRAAAPRTST